METDTTLGVYAVVGLVALMTAISPGPDYVLLMKSANQGLKRMNCRKNCQETRKDKALRT